LCDCAHLAEIPGHMDCWVQVR